MKKYKNLSWTTIEEPFILSVNATLDPDTITINDTSKLTISVNEDPSYINKIILEYDTTNLNIKEIDKFNYNVTTNTNEDATYPIKITVVDDTHVQQASTTVTLTVKKLIITDVSQSSDNTSDFTNSSTSSSSGSTIQIF